MSLRPDNVNDDVIIFWRDDMILVSNLINIIDLFNIMYGMKRRNISFSMIKSRRMNQNVLILSNMLIPHFHYNMYIRFNWLGNIPVNEIN